MTLPRLYQWFTLFLVVGLGPSPTVQADEAIRFARTPDISPDGQLVAFSYLGDIWTVPATGGVARPITMHLKHELYPSFSPDGRQLAFSSNRHGQYDVFVVSVHGGRPTRLTFDSAQDYVCGWSPDGRSILFTSTRCVDYPTRTELYAVPATGGRVRRVTFEEGREGQFSPDGQEIALVRGPGSWYRKGYRGSANDEIWICRSDGSQHRQLTRFPGQDNSPCWSPDRKYLYYVTDAFGTPANIVRQRLVSGPGQPLAIKDEPQQITFHKADGVRQARLSRNGDWLVYECGFDLWLVSTRGGEPRQLRIEAYADDKTNPERQVTYSNDATEFAVSPDERSIAFVVHGEIFLIPRGGGKAQRLTDHPANDHGLAWAPDSRSLAFLSDRNGREDVYLLQSADPATTALSKAGKFKVQAVTQSAAAESGLSFAPDGKRLAFLREGRLVTSKIDGTDEQIVAGDTMVIDYDWSPDSRWLCYSRLDGSYASELYVVPTSGPTRENPIRNVTRYATFNAYIHWSRNNRFLAFLSERGLDKDRRIHILALQKPSVAGASSAGIDWDDIHLRVFQPVPLGASRLAISHDGQLLAFRSDENDDLWLASLTGGNLKRLTTGGVKPAELQWSRLIPSLLYYRDKNGKLFMAANSSDNKGPLEIPFLAELTINRQEVYTELFDQSWRAVHDHFYDPKFHGVDWNRVREHYRPLLKNVVMREDLDALISLMLGELNASHVSLLDAPTGGPDETTAQLGLLFDERWTGSGLKVTEILARGPADRRGLDLKPGSLITAVDEIELESDTNLARLLNGKEKEEVTLTVLPDPDQPDQRRRVRLRPTSPGSIKGLLYERWVQKNYEVVAARSKGKLGYIHIPSMDENGLTRFLRALYSENFDKEGLVLDVRFNAGGFTHDKILSYLGGKVHTFFSPRYGSVGTVFRFADRKWSRPVVLLINNRSFSDAEIFPSAFRTLGLGKLVGVPTGGHVIGATRLQLIDGSIFRLPQTGIFTVQGVNMEKQGVVPDVEVDNDPDALQKGVDAQLEKATDVLLAEVRNAKPVPSNITQLPFRPGPSSTIEVDPATVPRKPINPAGASKH